MKTSVVVISTLLFMLAFSQITMAQTQTSEKKIINKTKQIRVYYFHFSHRCATCKAVEAQSKKALDELYPELMKKSTMTFTSINLDLPEGKAKAKSLKVSGQTLLIVAGSKKINLTNAGFMYARSNPEKLKQIIKQNIDPLIL